MSRPFETTYQKYLDSNQDREVKTYETWYIHHLGDIAHCLNGLASYVLRYEPNSNVLKKERPPVYESLVNEIKRFKQEYADEKKKQSLQSGEVEQGKVSAR